MPPTTRKQTGDDAPAEDTPPQSSASEVSQDTGEYIVLVDALTLKLDKDGKKVKRFGKDAKIKLDPEIHDIDRLVALKAVGKPNDEGRVRYPTAAGLSVAAAQENQGTPPVPVDSGAVPLQNQGEGETPVANGLDDGGVGSDPTPPPSA